MEGPKPSPPQFLENSFYYTGTYAKNEIVRQELLGNLFFFSFLFLLKRMLWASFHVNACQITSFIPFH